MTRVMATAFRLTNHRLMTAKNVCPKLVLLLRLIAQYFRDLCRLAKRYQAQEDKVEALRLWK